MSCFIVNAWCARHVLHACNCTYVCMYIQVLLMSCFIVNGAYDWGGLVAPASPSSVMMTHSALGIYIQRCRSLERDRRRERARACLYVCLMCLPLCLSPGCLSSSPSSTDTDTYVCAYRQTHTQQALSVMITFISRQLKQTHKADI